MIKLISLCICMMFLFGCSKKDSYYRIVELIKVENKKLITTHEPKRETIDYSRIYPRIIYRIR